jgi:hypothetical protein
MALWNDERAFRLTLRALVMALAAILPQLPLDPEWVKWLTPLVAGLAMLIPAGEMNNAPPKA